MPDNTPTKPTEPTSALASHETRLQRIEDKLDDILEHQHELRTPLGLHPKAKKTPAT